MELSFAIASEADTVAVATLRRAVAADLTRRYGHGHWSATATDASVQRDIATARVLLARHDGRDVATLRLATKKPWAIDPVYFTDRHRVLYLTDMAVLPELQGRGLGRQCIAEACRLAREWPADVIRLDAYDGAVGAGAFYEKCGFRERGRITYRRTPLIYYELLL